MGSNSSRVSPRGPADDQEVAALRAALAAIAPRRVLVGVRRVDERDVAALHAAEAAVVAAAVLKRRREFASGRVLLRELIGDVTILPGPSRAPLLPTGVRGSLAHDDVFAVAAVSRDRSIAALGVDVEPATVLDGGVAALILRDDERGLDAHLAFTLKEAAYKAWSGLGGRILDHHDVALVVGETSFTARVVDDGTTFTGSWTSTCGRWLAVVAAPA